MGGSRGSGGTGGPDLPGKLQVAIGFIRNTGMNLLEKHLDPKGPNASRGGSYGPLQ